MVKKRKKYRIHNQFHTLLSGPSWLKIQSNCNVEVAGET